MPTAEASPSSGSALPAWWPWVAGAALAAALGIGLTLLLRRQRAEEEEEVPQIERPLAASMAPSPSPPAALSDPVRRPAAQPRPAPAAPPPPQEEAAEEETQGPISCAIEARQLSITLTAATLSYRLTLTNIGDAPLTGVAIAGDMIAAHASLTREQQMAHDYSPLSPQHQIASLRPGESAQVTGELRLPLNRILPIRRGQAAFFVPLARLRVEAEQGSKEKLVRTALVGQRASRPGAGLQPFRLDLGPRIYREVTQKIF